MKTVVYQSFRTENVPGWINTCMDSVKKWSASNNFDYNFIDDKLFSYVPEWYRKKVNDNIHLVSDLARLNLAQSFLKQGYDRTLWIDADIIIFSPANFKITSDKKYAFCHQIWVKRISEEQYDIIRAVNNSITYFEKQNSLLDFYIYACQEIVKIHHDLMSYRHYNLAVGTLFLKSLNEFLKLDVIRNVGLFSPLIMHAIVNDKEGILDFYMENIGNRIYAANLCLSFNNMDVQEIKVDDRLFESVIEKLLKTKGDVVNKYIP